MRRKFWIGFMLVIILLTTGVMVPIADHAGSIVAHAQASNQPLIFLKDGDLWKWDGYTLTQLSTWGYNERPVLSPDGSRIAYNSWATLTVNVIAAGKQPMGYIPSNIWVMETATGNAFRAASQPPNAVFFQDGVADVATMRGTPVWSPDGTKLAWAELLVPDNRFQLMTYDLTTGLLNVIVPQLSYPWADAGFIAMPDLLWSHSGIALVSVAVNPSSADFEETLFLYNPQGQLITQTLVGSSATEWVFNKQWITYNGQEYIGLVYPSGKRFLLNPRTSVTQDMPALPELYTQQTPANTVTAFLAASVDSHGNPAPTWSAVYANRQKNQTLTFTGSTDNIAIAGDGQSLAYIDDAVYIWRNGVATPVPGTEGIASFWDVSLVWGVNAWRVRTDWPGIGGGGSITCTLTPRLTIGAAGQILPGLPNVIRTQPWRGSDSAIIGQIPGGGVFSVLNGPRCDSEGRYWWQVQYQGLTGWTAEGETGYYWAQPYNVTSPTPTCTLAPRLTPQTVAYVLPGLPNIIRTHPRRSSDSLIVGRIPGNGIFSVLSGPVCGPEGRHWWEINYAGLAGWTAEGERGSYWVSPFGCPSSPAPRLAPGMQAIVTPGLPNRLRSGPGSNYSVLSRIPAGGVFTVLGGPQCGPEGWSYWRVQYGNTIGWTAEGDGATYWLERVAYNPVPVPIPPTPIPTPVSQNCLLPSRLSVGATAYVIPGPSNVIRSQPWRGSNSAIVGQIPGGAFFRVKGISQCDAEGIRWWPISYWSVQGWTGESQGNDYWAAPFSCSNSPLTRLMPGSVARVTPGEPNVIRSAPGTGTSSAITGQIPGGGAFTVLAGPQCGNDGRIWWQVDYSGKIGWTAEGEGNVYWLEPVSD